MMFDRFHQLILFEDKSFEGPHKHVFRSIDFLDDFNDTASSFAVLAGTWELYADANFQRAYGSTFAPRIGGYSWVEDYHIVDNTLSSARLAGEEERQVPHLILFSDLQFGGDHKHIVASTAIGGGWAGAQSMVNFVGTWQLTFSNGATSMLGPGTYPNIGSSFPGDLHRIDLVAATPVPADAIPHLILFDDIYFKASHRHIFDTLPSLKVWKGRVSAIVVENAAWQIFVEEDFVHPQGHLLTRGIYPVVEDYDIANDQPASVQRRVFVSQPPIVSVTNMNNGQNIFTAHADNYRLGWNAHETDLTPANVRVPDFGLIWRRADILGQDGKPARVYGQPLYVSATGALKQDIVIIATASNDVLALDAATGQTVWQTHLGAAGNALNDDDFSAGIKDKCQNTSPLHGVNATPAVVSVGSTQLLYVCFLSKLDLNGGSGNIDNDFNQGYFFHALNVATGAAELPAPVRIKGSFTHKDGSTVRFRPYMHTQRGGLTLYQGPWDGEQRGWILATFSSRCDQYGQTKDEDWQGWVIGIRALDNATTSTVMFASSTNNFGEQQGCGGIWGTAGVSVDDNNCLYTVAGNGFFDGNENFANSVIKLADASGVLDSYTPRDWMDKNGSDLDLGSCSAVLLPPMPVARMVPAMKAPTINVVATAAKDGRVYLVDADQPGGGGQGMTGGALWRQQIFSPCNNPYNGGIAVTPAFFNGGRAGQFLYYCSADDSDHRGMVAIQFGHIDGEGQFGLRVLQFEGPRMTGAPGAPFVSSRGAADAIVWAVDSFRQANDDGADSSLRAWNAVTGEPLYTSAQTPAQDLGDGRKFVSVAVIKGKVLFATASIACYGLKRDDQ
jgi:hypothetical protein